MLLYVVVFTSGIYHFLYPHQLFGQQVAKREQSLHFWQMNHCLINFLLETCLLLKIKPYQSTELAARGPPFTLSLSS